MDSLIKRLAEATAPARGLDAEIAIAVGIAEQRHGLPNSGWVSRGPHHAVEAPAFTRMIDAVRPHIPDGHSFACGDLGEDDRPWATITTPDGRDVCASAAFPAIALSIAMLKARVAINPEETMRQTA